MTTQIYHKMEQSNSCNCSFLALLDKLEVLGAVARGQYCLEKDFCCIQVLLQMPFASCTSDYFKLIALLGRGMGGVLRPRAAIQILGKT